MENKINSKSINSRSSKAEILNYTSLLEDQLKVYEEKLKACKENITPETIIKNNEQAARDIKLNGISLEDIKKLDGYLKEFCDNFAYNLEVLHLVQEQIKLEKEKLETIYKLKVEAESLFALMTAKKEIIENLDDKIKNLEIYYKIESDNKENELKSQLRQIQLKAQYEREEEQIRFNNELNLKLMAFKKDQEDLDRRKIEIDEMYKTVDNLKLTIANNEIDKDMAIEEALIKAKDEFTKEQIYINKLKEADYEKKLAVLQCEKDVIVRNNEELVVQLEHLQELLKDSNTSITEIASKTMDNYHLLKSLEDIKNIALTTASNNTGNKK